MTDEENKRFSDLNFRAILLLGMVTPLLIDCKNSRPKSEHYKFEWFIDALNAVFYENKPIPHLPEKELL